MMFHVSLSTAHAYKFCLTLSLPIFWQLCSLSATFILTARGILESQANINSLKFYFFFVLFLSITFNKYPKFEVSTSIIVWTLHNVCKQRGLNKVWGGSPSRRSATLAVCYGSERVKIKKKKTLKTVWPDCKANSKTKTQRLTKCGRQINGHHQSINWNCFPIRPKLAKVSELENQVIDPQRSLWQPIHMSSTIACKIQRQFLSYFKAQLRKKKKTQDVWGTHSGV